MNKRIKNWIAVVVLTFGMSLPSHASVTCLAPEPTCAVVLLSALVTGIVIETDDEENRNLQTGTGHATLEAVVEEIENMNDERLAVRIRDAGGDTPGFDSIVSRFERGRHEGPASLDSLMERNPRLFDDLDRIAVVIAERHPDEVVAQAYGPKRLAGGEINWGRYAALARDALVIRRHMRTDSR
jgi:hypothetical protein